MNSNKNKDSRFFESFGFALKGIAVAFRGRNFKVQACFGIAAIVLGIAFGVNAYEWLAIVICIGMVLAGEAFNTAIEAVVDIASPDWNPTAKIAKDCAAGAVLCMSFASLTIAGIIFIPKFLQLFLIMG